MSSAAGRRGNNPAASRLGQAIDFVINGIAFPKLPSFKKGTCPTLLDAIEAQKVKMFIENILFNTAGRVVTGSPQRNRAELVFTPDGNFVELWLQTDLRWDSAPMLSADLNTNGKVIYAPQFDLYLTTTVAGTVTIQNTAGGSGVLTLGRGMPGTRNPGTHHASNSSPDDTTYFWPNDGSNGQVLTTDGNGNLSWGAGGSGAPTDATYVVMSASGDLSAERVLTAGSGISITDGGANSTVTIAATGGGGGMTSFEVDGDSGPAQTIEDGNTLFILGGTDLASVASATDTITLNHSASGVSAATFGDASNVAQIAVNAQGHITSASEVAISGLITQGEALNSAGSQMALITWADATPGRITLKQGKNITMAGASGIMEIGNTHTTFGIMGELSGPIYVDFTTTRATVRLTGGTRYTGVPSFITTGGPVNNTAGSIDVVDQPIYISYNAAIVPNVSDGAGGWNQIYGTSADANQWFIYAGTGITVTGGGGAGNSINISADNNGTVTSIECANDGTFIDLTGGTITSSGTIRADLSATGTASSSTFLRGDNTWADPGAAGMTSFDLDGDSGTTQTVEDGNTVTLAGGNGLDSVASATDTVTFAIDDTVAQSIDISADGGTASGDGTVNFDNFVSANSVGLVAGDNVTITGSNSAGTVKIEAASGGGGGGAPTDASYVTLGVNGTLTNERVLTAGTGISLTDGGAGSTVTIAATGGGGGGPGATELTSGTSHTATATDDHIYWLNQSGLSGTFTLTLPSASSVGGVTYRFYALEANWETFKVAAAGSDVIFDNYDEINNATGGLSAIETAYTWISIEMTSDGDAAWVSSSYHDGYWYSS